MISIENRYIFQIGGFDDFDFDIYCYDTEKAQSSWIEIKLKDEIQIMKNIPAAVSSNGSEMDVRHL